MTYQEYINRQSSSTNQSLNQKAASNTDYVFNVAPKEEVNHPDRYQSSNNIECIDAIEAATENLSGREAFDIGCAIKYLWRYKEKNGVEDLKKAKWYIDDVIKNMQEEIATIATVDQQSQWSIANNIKIATPQVTYTEISCDANTAK